MDYLQFPRQTGGGNQPYAVLAGALLTAGAAIGYALDEEAHCV